MEQESKCNWYATSYMHAVCQLILVIVQILPQFITYFNVNDFINVWNEPETLMYRTRMPFV